MEPLLKLYATVLQHAHHNTNSSVGTSAYETKETHFKLELVSDKFAGLPAVRRHQLVGRHSLCVCVCLHICVCYVFTCVCVCVCLCVCVC